MALKVRGKYKYWYRIYHYRCPECGNERIIKMREKFAPRPKNRKDQHTYVEAYDYCKEEIKL